MPRTREGAGEAKTWREGVLATLGQQRHSGLPWPSRPVWSPSHVNTRLASSPPFPCFPYCAAVHEENGLGKPGMGESCSHRGAWSAWAHGFLRPQGWESRSPVDADGQRGGGLLSKSLIISALRHCRSSRPGPVSLLLGLLPGWGLEGAGRES